MTKGYSLEKWDADGMLDREVALYERLRDSGNHISIISYGGRSEFKYSERLQGIKICCNWLNLPLELYENYLLWLHFCTLVRGDLFKTNQTNGGAVALKLARKFKKPLIARCGYMWSDFVGSWKGKNSAPYQDALELEEKLYSECDRAVVTTQKMLEDLQCRVPMVSGKIGVIPNYVDTTSFSPEKCDKEYDILFVGRLYEQKNVEALLEVVRGSRWTLKIIGQGPLKEGLREKFQDLKHQVIWVDKVPNRELSSEINKSRVFVLPSFFEGHPKVLIEAMACGACVIGTDVEGIREVIQDGVTGMLCGTDASSMRMVLHNALRSDHLRVQLGKAAREYGVKEYSLDKIVEMELAVYREVLSRTKHSGVARE